MVVLQFQVVMLYSTEDGLEPQISTPKPYVARILLEELEIVSKIVIPPVLEETFSYPREKFQA